MMAFAHQVLADVERLAWLEGHDTGTPISQARADIRACRGVTNALKTYNFYINFRHAI